MTQYARSLISNISLNSGKVLKPEFEDLLNVSHVLEKIEKTGVVLDDITMKMLLFERNTIDKVLYKELIDTIKAIPILEDIGQFGGRKS